MLKVKESPKAKTLEQKDIFLKDVSPRDKATINNWAAPPGFQTLPAPARMLDSTRQCARRGGDAEMRRWEAP